ncbi:MULTISPECIES: DoxX family protein [unclassified Luteococcus]|uniref:DoxX family protein n=1 Tax=unclassified Luteococcus TaxID=2639923 RepID=UPI00313D22B3
MIETATSPALRADDRPTRTARDWIGLLARLVLGGALLVAGLLKIGNLDGNVLSVRAYQIDFLPYSAEKMIGYGLPVLEIIVGLLLLAGLFTRISALIGALMMLAFIGAIASAWARGLSIDCGCFSQGGQTEDPKYLWEILRDALFALCGAWLVWRPRTPFSVDGWLFRPITGTVDHTDPELDDIDPDEDSLVREDPAR